MKSLKELRNFDLNPHESASTLRYFIKQNIDFNVFLPTKGIKLQRDFVWTLEQKRELIMSILIGRHIPHMAIVNIIIDDEKKYTDLIGRHIPHMTKVSIIIDDEKKNTDLYQIIDGKQRLSTMIDFYQNKFTIVIDDIEYYFNDLPDDYQKCISHYHFRYYLINEDYDKPMTDEQKIMWFKFLNFSGTPQDKEHIQKLI